MNLFLYRLKQISFVRVISYPFVKVKDLFDKIKYKKTHSYNFFKACRNMYEGKRCFIIGNGPSLRPEDLGKIQDEISFASNRIFYIFDQTKWRPTYYMCTDKEIISSNYKKIKELNLDNILLSKYAQKFIWDDDNAIKYMIMSRVMLPKKYRLKKISEDVSKKFSPVPTVTCSAIELAIYMGFKEIYLLGMDNNYNIKNKSGAKVINSDSYFKGMKAESVTIGDNNTKEARDYYYEVYRKEAEKHGVKIYNATRGGMLEVYERVNFDDIIDK
ncbi:MAG: 6-hydroxymethylpterin diphosphokinase MptE-like protein [Butyrivibrio sp.]